MVTGESTDSAAQTTGMSAERMGKVDTAWLRMDSPHNLMMIMGVWVLRPGLAYTDLHQRLEERLLKFPRFMQCALEDNSGASWVQDPHFMLSHHLVRAVLPVSDGSAPQEALQHLLAQLCTQPLNHHRPLWQMHLIENYEGGSALVVRIHHCIADGMALMAVMQSLVDGGTAPAQSVDEPFGTSAAGHRDGAHDWGAQALLKSLTGFAVRALDGVANKGTNDVAKWAFQTLADVAALAMMEDDSKTSLRGTPDTAKRLSWCAALPLEEVKVVGRSLQCSVNDVLLACVAGALGRYLRMNGESVQGKEIRVMVPVNLRSLSDASHHLGNNFGVVPLVLPVGLDNPVACIDAVRRRMHELKGSTQPLLAMGMLAAAGVMNKPAQDALLGFFSKKTTAVVTNVPGPAEKKYLCGSCIEEAIFWVPQSGTVGLGISIFSYGGGVQFGILSDARLCPDPQKIADLIGPEFNRLLTLSLMLPWGHQWDEV